jgi:hypothetical protein
MQLFGFKFASCSVDGAQQLCPPGTPPQECPVYPDCYVPCQESQAFSWVNVTGRQGLVITTHYFLDGIQDAQAGAAC